MKLREWLDERGMSNTEFGGRIKRTAEAVRRYAAGDRVPDRDTMPLIVRETDGAVQPNDFFDVPVQGHERAATNFVANPTDGNVDVLTAPAGIATRPPVHFTEADLFSPASRDDEVTA